MTDTKHTPGPWAVSYQEDGGCGIRDKKGSPIALVYTNFEYDVKHGHKQSGNVHLIAAAPELLEALEELTTAILDLSDEDLSEWYFIVNAKKAIAKAKGES